MKQTLYRIEYVLRQSCGLIYQKGLVTVTSMHPKEWQEYMDSRPEATNKVSLLSSQIMTDEEKRMYEIEMRNAIIAQGKSLGW